MLCPACSVELRAGRESFHCDDCGECYPLVGGLPVLLETPARRLAGWRNRYGHYLASLERECERLAELENTDPLRPETRQRYQRLRDGKKRLLATLRRIGAPLKGTGNAPLEVHQAAGDEPAAHPPLMGYYPSLVRDWAFGDHEVQRQVDAVVDGAPASQLGRVVCIGAGGGRIPYELKRRGHATHVTLVDIDPMLLLFAQHFVRGASCELLEFPRVPRDLTSVAVAHDCRAPEAFDDSAISFVLADGTRPVAARSEVDTLLTPWFIDVVGVDLPELCRRLNRLLDIGARWVNLGPLGFSPDMVARNYSPDEVRAIVTEAGFAIESWQFREVPYLRSPNDCQRRFENVLSFCVRKTSEVTNAGGDEATDGWRARDDVPVPAMEVFTRRGLVNSTVAAILSAVDGEKTIEELGQELSPLTGVGPEQTASMVRAVLVRTAGE